MDVNGKTLRKKRAASKAPVDGKPSPTKKRTPVKNAKNDPKSSDQNVGAGDENEPTTPTTTATKKPAKAKKAAAGKVVKQEPKAEQDEVADTSSGAEATSSLTKANGATSTT